MDDTQNDELVYIRTNCVSLTIKGAASHPAFAGVTFREKESALNVTCDEPFEIQLAGDAEAESLLQLGRASIGHYRLRPIFFEQQRYEIVIEATDGHTVEFRHENYNIRKCISPVGRRPGLLSGIINFGNEIGMSDLVLIVDGRNYLKLTIEVFPSKISYKEDYKAIVADVTMEVYNLVFDFLKKTYDSFDVSSRRQSSPVEFFAIIRKIYDEFITAADMVIAKPHHILQTERKVLPAYKVRRTDHSSARWIEKHPEQAVRLGDSVLAANVLAVEKHVTYNTKENRLTKYMLHSTAVRLEQFRKQYSLLNRQADADAIGEIDRMIRGIQRRCGTGFLREVDASAGSSGMSLVFSMAPGYRDLYRCYLLLQHGLSVSGSVFSVSVKDLAVLYEYWCFIKLNSLMKDRYRLLSQDIIKVSGNGLFVSLIKGKRSQVRYLNPENGEVITLSYNPKEINVPTVSQKPDNVLRLEKKGASVGYEYIFDAKYRINAAPEGSMYQRMYGTPGPQEDDINTMHRYRDAIVYQNKVSPYERTMFGAYVLFPYHNREEYRNHRFYKSIEQVNIGGLPFLPSETQMVSEMLDELVSDSPAAAFERATLPMGIETRLAKVDWERRDVLIGTFRNQAQFEACRNGLFYYIPAKRVPDSRLPVHYIAMYQTPHIFPNNGGIYYCGEVLRSALVRRKNIREVPMRKSADPEEFYYYFRVRAWQPLARPILPKESGFISEYTNLFLLENSEFVPELLLRSEEEYRFYSELKRRTNEAVISGGGGENGSDERAASGFEYNGIKILFDDGQIKLIRDGKLLGHCRISAFSHHPNAMFRELLKKVEVEKWQ